MISFLRQLLNYSKWVTAIAEVLTFQKAASEILKLEIQFDCKCQASHETPQDKLRD